MSLKIREDERNQPFYIIVNNFNWFLDPFFFFCPGYSCALLFDHRNNSRCKFKHVLLCISDLGWTKVPKLGAWVVCLSSTYHRVRSPHFKMNVREHFCTKIKLHLKWHPSVQVFLLHTTESRNSGNFIFQGLRENIDSFTTGSKLRAVKVAERTFWRRDKVRPTTLLDFFPSPNLVNFNIQSGRLRFPPSNAAFRHLRPNLAKLGSNWDVPAADCLVTEISDKSTNKRKKQTWLGTAVTLRTLKIILMSSPPFQCTV